MKPAMSLLILVAAGAALPVEKAIAADAFAWGVGMRDQKLIVIVDAGGSPSNMVVDSASFNATFIDLQGRVLGKSNISLPARQIESGKRKSWSFSQPYPSASRVITDSLLTAWHADGSKSDGQELHASEALKPSVQAGGVVIPPPASLADRCDIYGRRAVEQNTFNKARRCGYSGSRWDSRSDFHSNWCRTRPESEAEDETLTRDALLRKCVHLKVLAIVPAAP